MSFFRFYADFLRQQVAYSFLSLSLSLLEVILWHAFSFLYDIIEIVTVTKLVVCVFNYYSNTHRYTRTYIHGFMFHFPFTFTLYGLSDRKSPVTSHFIIRNPLLLLLFTLYLYYKFTATNNNNNNYKKTMYRHEK